MSSSLSTLEIELFIMSRCPDAWSAESTFLDVQNSGDLKREVSFTFHVITNATNDGCMHGGFECTGNALLLTIQQFNKILDEKVKQNEKRTIDVLSFLGEYNTNTSQIGVVPSTHLDQSLSRIGVSEAQQEEIIGRYEREGLDKVWASGAYSKHRGARYSATVMIKGRPEVLGIRDSGAWKNLSPENDGSVQGWVDFFNNYQSDAEKSGL